MNFFVNADPLQGFTYDPAAGRFRYGNTKQYVAIKRIKQLVKAQSNDSVERLGAVTLLFLEGGLWASVWAMQVMTELRRQHLIQAALGAGGWDQLSEDDLARIDTRLTQDYPKVLGTAADVVEGVATLAVVLARVNNYVGTARTQYFDAQRDRVERSTSGAIVIERRVLGNGQHCPDCVDLYNMGWCMQGVLPSPGMDSVCGGACRCDLIQQEIPAAEMSDWLNTKR